jgi:serine/threonine protein kinase
MSNNLDNSNKKRKRNRYGLSLDLSNINTQQQSCIGDELQQEQFSKLLNELDVTINNNYDTCKVQCDKSLSKYGSFGIICDHDESDKLYKFSNIFDSVRDFINNTNFSCKIYKNMIQIALDEISNSTKFNELAEIFPHNVMKIYESKQCKNSDSKLLNLFVIEKIKGVILKDFLEQLDVIQQDNQNLFISILLQSVYVLLYANKHGYYHNDIKTDNLMVYEIENTDNITLDNLILDNKKVVLTINKINNKLYVVKLIDFGISKYQTELSQVNSTIHEVYLIIILFFNNLLKKTNYKSSIFHSNVQSLRTTLTNYNNFITNINPLLDIFDILFNMFNNLTMNIDISFSNIFTSLRAISLDDINKLTFNPSNEIILQTLQNISQLYPNIQVTQTTQVQNGGNNNDNYYDQYKYYKTKYINLRTNNR